MEKGSLRLFKNERGGVELTRSRLNLPTENFGFQLFCFLVWCEMRDCILFQKEGCKKLTWNSNQNPLPLVDSEF